MRELTFSGKTGVLLAAVKSPEIRKGYVRLLERYDLTAMEQALQQGDPTLPEGYAKVYRSYLAVKNRKQHDDHGNMNAFIKHGDSSKVSLETARSAVAYLEGL